MGEGIREDEERKTSLSDRWVDQKERRITITVSLTGHKLVGVDNKTRDETIYTPQTP